MKSDVYAMVAKQPGPPTQLVEMAIEIANPGSNEVRIRHTAIGVNFIDCYYRSGLYPWPVKDNLILGSEAVGIVEAVGPDVRSAAVGDRVAYTLPNNAYSTHRIIHEQHVVKVPNGISDETAAASMLKGLTARYLLKDSYKLQAGQAVLFHAAAGGVGSIAGQWMSAMGVHAVGTAGGPAKCEMAKAHGFADVIDYSAVDFPTSAKSLHPAGFDVVYDSVGKDTLLRSLSCLKRHGTLVNFGQSSGAVTDFEVSHLAAGSYYLTRPVLFHFTADRNWLQAAATDLFDMIMTGSVKIHIHETAPLREVARIHSDLENRRTSGSVILIP